MGKRSKKLNKLNKILQQEAGTKCTEELLTGIAQHVKEGEYNLALEGLAELLKNKVYDAEAMYAGAYSYFMLGDHKRAVDWINNTLVYAPRHLPVRVLLARLCLLEERVNDAMALYEYVLEHGGNTLDASVIEEITIVGEGYSGQKARSIEADYPRIAKLIEPISKYERKTIGEKTIVDTQEEKNTVDDLCYKIMMEEQALSYKLQMLNKFASEFYLQGQLREAETLLLAALKIDNTNESTLRNMFMVQIGLGRKEAAEKIAAEKGVTDFALLKILQSC